MAKPDPKTALHHAMLLTRMGRLNELFLANIAARAGLGEIAGPGETWVLAVLMQQDPGQDISPGALAALSLISPAGMTKTLDRLERAQLIARRPHATDRRSVVVALTPAGRTAAQTMLAAIDAAYAPLEALSTGKWQRILRRHIAQLEETLGRPQTADWL